ncbi:MAG TPA: AMP-binding protein [Gaiellaceae bacterium]|nr:AMP-binding protein [Gaiellaceae bacterium]
MNLAHVLVDASRDHAGRPALHQGDGTVSFHQLEERARAAAAQLRELGIGTGDRVALKLPNGPAFAAAWFGTLQLGAIVVPLNVLLARPEVDQRMRISGARLLVDDASFFDSELEPMPDIADCGAADPAVILFTSGTSGRAKGAVLTHGGIRFAARAAAHALGLTPDDVVLGAAPFSHVLGQSTGLVGTLSAGASIAIVERFDSDSTLRFMSDTWTTILLGVPTMCIALCEAARTVAALPPVRIAHIGGAPVPLEVARDFEETFGGEVVEGYGLTELSGIATTYVPGQPRKAGSVGMPLDGTELRIAGVDGSVLPANEPGEVEFRGPSVIPGYWKDEESTAEALSPEGWLSTGDIGYVDEDGYLFLVDRKKDVIIRGGYNVYPREVEEVLYAHPDVLEAAVVGVPHRTLGEEVAALVVGRPGVVPEPDAIRAFARDRVAAYKYPRRVLLVDSLPKGPTGKILKREIDVQALLGRESST